MSNIFTPTGNTTLPSDVAAVVKTERYKGSLEQAL